MLMSCDFIVLRFKFDQNRLSSFGAVGGRNLPFPIDLTIGLYNSMMAEMPKSQRCCIVENVTVVEVTVRSFMLINNGASLLICRGRVR